MSDKPFESRLRDAAQALFDAGGEDAKEAARACMDGAREIVRLRGEVAAAGAAAAAAQARTKDDRVAMDTLETLMGMVDPLGGMKGRKP